MKNRHTMIMVCLCALISIFLQAKSAVGQDKPFGRGIVGPTQTSSPLSLSACIKMALENNPSLRAEKNQTDVAKAEREIVESDRWPSLQLKGSGFIYDDDQRLAPAQRNGEAGLFGKELLDIGMTLRMPLFTGGRIINSIRAAELNEAAFLHRFARSRQELVFNVTSAFYTILGRRYQLKSIDFSRDVLKKDKERIQVLIKAKKAAPVDLLRLDVRLANMEQSRVRVGNDLSIAWRVLCNLMGVQTGCKEQQREVEDALTPVPPMPQIDSAFETALDQRPDFLAKQALVNAQSRKVAIARKERWPRISLEGAYGYRYLPNPSDGPDDGDDSEDRGMIGLTVDIPLFEGGRIQAQIRLQNEKLSAIQEEMNALRLQVQKEVETAVLNMQSALQQIRTQEKTIAQAREALRIEQEKYRLGRGAILDVLDAQNALLETETEYYRSLAEYHIAIGQFRLAKGVTE